ncbi:MAG: hypothetical protein QW423_01395 [Candidatus Aenigmatarchaeota archaeon]
MGKGQSITIQFLLFFLIGFSIFISLGSFFKYQSDLLRQRISSSGINATSSYLSSIIITMVASCKECDFIALNTSVYNTTAGYSIRIIGENDGLNVTTTSMSLKTTVHNFLDHTLEISGSSSSNKPIILTFNRTNNKIEVM